MLPEFPRAYDAIQKVWNRILFDAAGFSDPLISQMRVRVQREGDRAFLGEAETEYKAQSVSHQWKPEIAKGVPTEEFFGLPQKIGAEIAMKQAKGVFEALTRPSPHTGTFSESDGPLSFDLWLEKMEGFELDFDENESPQWPTLFVSEAAAAGIRAQMNQGELTPEQAERQAEFVARKRKEFDERENRRRLVD